MNISSRERQIITVDSGSADLRYKEEGGPIQELIEDLQTIAKDKPTAIIKFHYNTWYIDVRYCVERLETDAEYTARIKYLDDHAKRVDELERQTYERLKAKYGNT